MVERLVLVLHYPAVYQPARPQVGVASSANRGQTSTRQQEPRHSERVAMGCDVEVVPGEASQGVQQRAPSLDDVLRAIRSGKEGELTTQLQ